jgi:hypothetical protein
VEYVPPAADWDALQYWISDFKPDIFHFRGHGEGGGLWLTKAREEVEAARARVREAQQRGEFSPEIFDEGMLVWTEGVAKLFDEHHPSLVILEACQSGAMSTDVVENLSLPRIAEQILARVPAVVAMQYTVNIETAGSFVQRLYRGIVEGRDVDEAVSRARSSLTKGKENVRDFADRAFGAPVVYLGSQGPLCEPIIVDVLTRCPDCATSYPQRVAQPFCSNCGYRMHFLCKGCQSKLVENPFTPNPDPDRPPTECRLCHVPFASGTFAAEVTPDQPVVPPPEGTPPYP